MTFKILVVEDEIDFREVLVDFLELKGYPASGISSISEYRSLDNLGDYALIILDRTLPDGDGLNILEAHRKISKIPVIILSGLGHVDERIKGLDADADHYLVKPVMMPELLAIVGRYARRTTNLNQNDNDSCWLINSRQWEITSPEGLTVKLTNSELLFLNCFNELNGKKVERDEVVSKLGYRPEIYDIRRLESMISRLRNKVKDSGINDFPLVTVYGSGYAFNAPLKIVGTPLL